MNWMVEGCVVVLPWDGFSCLGPDNFDPECLHWHLCGMRIPYEMHVVSEDPQQAEPDILISAIRSHHWAHFVIGPSPLSALALGPELHQYSEVSGKVIVAACSTKRLPFHPTPLVWQQAMQLASQRWTRPGYYLLGNGELFRWGENHCTITYDSAAQRFEWRRKWNSKARPIDCSDVVSDAELRPDEITVQAPPEGLPSFDNTMSQLPQPVH